jgi:hypothetical protein
VPISSEKVWRPRQVLFNSPFGSPTTALSVLLIRRQTSNYGDRIASRLLDRSVGNGVCRNVQSTGI